MRIWEKSTLHRLPTRRTKSGTACFDTRHSLVFPTRLMFSRCLNVDNVAVIVTRSSSVRVMALELLIDSVDPCREPNAPMDRVRNSGRCGSVAARSAPETEVDVRFSF